jgi:uncharacterized alpha-E superfamily protein
MLSRTADHVFWMSRYTERAENTARMLDVNYQTSLLPQSTAVAELGWQGLLKISELLPAYQGLYGEVTPQRVLQFMVREEQNPSSIISCLRAARENARAVRGTLTTEVWETQNQTWLELNRLLATDMLERDPHLSRGVTVGTMLVDEALYFMRLGTFLERGDNTARLLDVKFNAVDSDFYGLASDQDQEYDFYHWSAILRSVSGFEIYRRVYRNVIQPDRVAELLVLRPDIPRSLLSCMNEVVNNLDAVCESSSCLSCRLAGKLRADLKFTTIDEILKQGLHAFLVQFLEQINQIGAEISREFLVPA